MWLASFRRLIAGKSSQRKHSRPQRRRFIPTLDYLEERIALSTITVNAGDTAGLIAAINQANTDGSGDTINLTNSTYTISGVNNTTNGANGLPVITATNLTIAGNGSTINGASLGRLFDVASGAGLTLEDLTLTKGLASGANAQGGAIYNSGNLTLNTVIVGGNEVSGSVSGQGGGIYSNGGTLSLSSDIIGAQVAKYYNSSGQLTKQTTKGAGNLVLGGDVQGGGIYANGATLTVSGGSVSNNVLLGGAGDSGAAGTSKIPNGGAGGAGDPLRAAASSSKAGRSLSPMGRAFRSMKPRPAGAATAAPVTMPAVFMASAASAAPAAIPRAAVCMPRTPRSRLKTVRWSTTILSMRAAAAPAAEAARAKRPDRAAPAARPWAADCSSRAAA